MNTKYCTNCKKSVGVKRHIGWGTLFAIVITGGMWILFIPFYSKVCPLCKSSSFLMNGIIAPKKCTACNGTGECS